MRPEVRRWAGRLRGCMTRMFAEQGLMVMDAAGREFHALGAAALRAAIEQAEELEAALLARSAELERRDITRRCW